MKKSKAVGHDHVYPGKSAKNIHKPYSPDSIPPERHPAKSVESNTDVDAKYCLQRIRRSSLHGFRLHGVERPSLKLADTVAEYKQAFRLVHDEYVTSGYVPPSPDHPYYYSEYSLHPETAVFILKTCNVVVGSLSEIFDSQDMGLPIDELFKGEIDKLRDRGRTIVELSAFVTSRHLRMKNIMIYLCNAMLNYSRKSNVTDICIMVNPKHVKFYTKMFFFEPFGPEMFYDKIQAPAVPMMVHMEHFYDSLKKKYSSASSTEDLYSFFCGESSSCEMLSQIDSTPKKYHTPPDVLDFFKQPRFPSVSL